MSQNIIMSSPTLLTADDLEHIIRIYTPNSWTILQRISNTGSLYNLGFASFSLGIESDVDIVKLEWRLRTEVGDPISLEWNDGNFNGKIGSTDIVVPAGRSWYTIEVSLTCKTGIDKIVTKKCIVNRPIACGDLFAIYGQSLAVDFLAAANNDGNRISCLDVGAIPDSYTSCLGTWDAGFLTNYPPSWSQPGPHTAYRSSFCTEYLRLVSKRSGVACGLVGHAHSGMKIASLLPSTSDFEILRRVLIAGGRRFKGLLYVQGHGDSIERTSFFSYSKMLNALVQSIRGEAEFQFLLLCSIPSISTLSQGNHNYISDIRRAQLAFCEGNENALYISGLDATLDNTTEPQGVHPNQSGDMALARDFYRAACSASGFGARVDHKGPKLVAAFMQADGKSIELKYEMAPGSQIIIHGNPLDAARNYTVYADTDRDCKLEYDKDCPIRVSGRDKCLLYLSDRLHNERIFVEYRRSPDDDGIIKAGIYDDVTDDDEFNIGRQAALIMHPVLVEFLPPQ